MPINDRNLQGGQKLVARFKGQEHTVLVLDNGEGKFGFELDGATIYKSLSSAGSAVMGGTACNGWRFWSPEGSLPERAAKEQPAPKPGKLNGKTPSPATVRNIKRVPNQKNVPDGSTKWFCSACQKGFLAEGKAEPAACPEGHARELVDELAPVS